MNVNTIYIMLAIYFDKKTLILAGIALLIFSFILSAKTSFSQASEPYRESYKKKIITKGQTNDKGRQGLWEYPSFLDTALSFEGNFLNNQQEGKWTYIANNHTISEIYYQKGRIDSATSYYESGQVLYIYKNINDSMAFAKSYYENGQLHQMIPIVDHQINGITEIYFPNGQLHRKTTYKNSKIYKVINCYDQKGQKIFGGELSKGTGDFIFYHLPMDINEDTLIIMSSEKYKEGILNGEASYIRINGKAKERGSYENDIKVGIWEEYDENGKFIGNRDYQYTGKLQKGQFKGGAFPYLVDYSINRYSDPAYSDGEDNLYRFIGQEIQYPNAAKERGIRGTVYINFSVNKLGHLEDIRILRGIGGGCDEECIRVTKELPRWQPGTIYGFPVNVEYNMPIKFSLQK